MIFTEEILFFFFSGGIINGTILAMILVFRKPSRRADKILGSLLLLFACELFCISFFDKSIRLTISSPLQLFLMVVVNFMFLYGVIFYFYVRSLVYEIKIPKGRDIVHFVPFFLFIAAGTGLYLGGENGAIGSFFLWFLGALYLLQVVLGGGYMVLALNTLRDYRIRSRNRYSNPDKINLNWLNRITLMQILLWLISLLNTILILISGSTEGFGPAPHIIFYLMMTAIILFTGYFALQHPETFNLHIPYEPEPALQDRKAAKETEKAQYRHLKEIMKRDKPYLDPDLTIDSLSGQTGLPVYLLSRLINEHGGKNFFNFVNAYRVEEVKDRLMAPGFKSAGVLSIALECGFNSKTTFNTIFKKYTGMTPSAFRTRSID